MQRRQRSATDGNGETPAAAFARRMREERTARGLSQDRLATLVRDRLPPDAPKLYDSGVARIETGERTVTLNHAVAIAAVLQVDLPEMLASSPDMDAAAALARAEAQLADLEGQEQVIAAERQIAATKVKRLRAIVQHQELE